MTLLEYRYVPTTCRMFVFFFDREATSQSQAETQGRPAEKQKKLWFWFLQSTNHGVIPVVEVSACA